MNTATIASHLLPAPLVNVEHKKLIEFLEPQMRDFGGNSEADTDLWTLFAVPAAEQEGNAIARSLLANVTFTHDSEASEDEQWVLYFVDTANRPAAVHWLEDSFKVLRGEIRPITPAQRSLIQEIAGSSMPHRLAQKLVEMHAKGTIAAGGVGEAPVVRALLDRLHAREPLFYAAFLALLTNHLVDINVLLSQIIPEDVALQNEIVKGGLSNDPFLQSRQNAAADIRNLLVRFHVINALDQQKNTALRNPYAAHMDIFRDHDRITAVVDGASISLTRQSFIEAIRSIRRELYRGEEFKRMESQAPWIRDDLAYSFRFIKQRLDSRRDLSAMDGLFMLERAMEP